MIGEATRVGDVSTPDGAVTLSAAPGGGGGGTPGGSNTQVQFNDSGAFGGDAGFTYNKTTDIATASGGFSTAGQFVSALATGTAPLSVASTTLVTNLKAEYLGVNKADAFSDIDIATTLRRFVNGAVRIFSMSDVSGGATTGNWLQFRNAVLGAAPALAAQADTDINVNVNVIPLGTGRLQAGGVTVPTISSTDTLTNKSIVATQLTGIIPDARMPDLTGDVTTVEGAVATTIAAAAVTLAKMANLAQDQFIGRVTASTGVPETATITAAARTVLDDTTVGAMLTTLGGQPLDATLTSLAAVAGVAGDLLYANGTDAWTRLAKGTAAQVLTMNAGATAPEWAAAAGGTTLPVVDTQTIVKGSVDATKLLRFDVAGNTTGITGVLATAFTTAKTITFPNVTGTLAALNLAQTWTAAQLFDIATELQFRATTNRLYSNAVGELTLTAPTLLTLGSAGNTTFGDNSLRDVTPAFTGMINLGTAALEWADVRSKLATISGAVNFGSTLAVTGAATFSSTVATGALTVTGATSQTGICTKFNNVTTIGNGIPSEVATVDLTAQAAAIAATTIYAVPAAGLGIYRVSWVATITTVDATSCVLGGAAGFQLKYTDGDAPGTVVKTSNPTTVTVSAINATGTSISGTFNAYCKASTNLQYLFGYTAVGGQMRYNLHVRVEAL